jgi:hypothetical protein
VLFRMFSSVDLGCLRLHLNEYSICRLVGGLRITLKSVNVWKMVPSCLLWCVWRKMNGRSFEDRGRTLEKIKSLFSTHCIFGQLLLFLI